MKMDALEALTNAALGLLVSYAVTLWVLPLWGLTPSPVAAGQITALYFGVSWLRAFVLRRLFRGLE